jgi:hypothetical protein
MKNSEEICHGRADAMTSCSKPLRPGRPYKLWWRLRLIVSHFKWHLRTKGVPGVIKYSFLKLFGFKGKVRKSDIQNRTLENESLNLQPGEWVEVKSEAEILATLDEKGNYKGLHWMCNMRKFCGKKYRVYKRLERMLLESSGEYRQVKNTVLLEGVICDGEEWFGCDRSCYHFWREIWLRRIAPPSDGTAHQ